MLRAHARSFRGALLALAPPVLAHFQDAASSPGPVGLRVLDLSGVLRVLGEQTGSIGLALVVLGTECPVSNEMLPELGQLAQVAAEKRIEFFGVLSDPFLERSAALRWREEYGIAFPLLFDADGALAARLAPQRTPEAFLYERSGKPVYRGRIDDRKAASGVGTNLPRSRDLLAALEALGAGRTPAVSRTEPVGCEFEGWRESAPGGITWARHAAPILQAHCVECHREGGVAPFSLQGYEDAARRSRMIARVTGERAMPPWKAQPGFGDFLDQRGLDPRSIAVLAAWSEAGAPRGEESEAPRRTFGSDWALGEPDLVLTMPAAARIPAEGRDLFVVFALPTGLSEERWLRALEFRPGNPRVVHHALLYTDDQGRARALDERTGEPGYESFGSVGFPAASLGGWLPGNPPYQLPGGIGRRIARGSDVLIWSHYHPTGKEESDQSSIALWFAREPVQAQARMSAIWTERFLIPPGDPDFRIHVEDVLERDMRLLGAVPHMHYLGQEMKVVALLPDGETRPVVWVPRWDFRWQQWYRFRRPLDLPRGTKLVLDARFDNSAANPLNPRSPPEVVVSGDQTTNEMCKCFLEYAEPLGSAPASEADEGG